MYPVKKRKALVVLLQGISEGATDEIARLAWLAKLAKKW